MLSLSDWLFVILAMGLTGFLCWGIDKLINRTRTQSITHAKANIKEQALSGTRGQIRPRSNRSLSDNINATVSRPASTHPASVHMQTGDVVYPKSPHLNGLDEGHEQEAVIVTPPISGHQDPFHQPPQNQYTFASSYTSDPTSKPFLGFSRSASSIKPVSIKSNQAEKPRSEKKRWFRKAPNNEEALSHRKNHGNKGMTSASLAKERLQGLGLGRQSVRSLTSLESLI